MDSESLLGPLASTFLSTVLPGPLLRSPLRLDTLQDQRATGSIAIVIIAFVAIIAAIQTALSRSGADKSPFVGFRSWFEPDFLVRIRFSLGATPMVAEGYKKFREGIYRLARNDRDITVISHNYVDELRNLPKRKLNNIQALLNNLNAEYNGFDILLDSDLHTRVLQKSLTPSLPDFVGAFKEELDFTLVKAIPPSVNHDTWQEVEIFEILVQFITRMSGRILVGETMCRNEEWIKTAIKYSEQGIMTGTLLRFVPRLMHPVVVCMLPCYWSTHRWIRKGINLLVPLIESRRLEQRNMTLCDRPKDFLQWMMDAADENDGRPEKLARRQLIMALSSIHSSGMAGSHVLYDLCAHPEYIPVLREEAIEALRSDGGVWGPQTANKLRKLDSFLKESQRVNPVSLLNFYRVVQEPITLHDKSVLHPGSTICVAAYNISHDPTIIPHQEFDGLRFYKLRQNLDEDKKHRYVDTDKTHLHFGHGRNACPGRFLIALELKMIVAELLLDFDLKYPEGKGRPKNINVDEFLFPNPKTTMLIKRRVRESLT